MKDNKLVSMVLFVGVIVMSMGAFTDSIEKVWSFVDKRVIGVQSGDKLETKSISEESSGEPCKGPDPDWWTCVLTNE